MAVSDTIFTYGPANVTSLLATTLSNYARKMADNIFVAIPLLAWLGLKNKITEDGGATLIRPVMYSKNTTFAFYSADDVLDTTIQDPYTAGQYQWRQAAASVSITGRIERQNTGDSQVIDYVMAQIQHAELSIKDGIDQALFASSQVGPKLTPLPAIVNNTGTVGDINGSTNSWWQANLTTSGSFAARGLSDLRNAWNTVNVKNPQGPVDLILSDQNSYQFYEATLVPAVRFTDNLMSGDLGFESLKYKTATWTFDLNATSGTIYGLNSSALELVQHSEAIFKLSEWVKPADQDLKTAQVLWMGELTTNNRRKHFALSSVTA